MYTQNRGFYKMIAKFKTSKTNNVSLFIFMDNQVVKTYPFKELLPLQFFLESCPGSVFNSSVKLFKFMACASSRNGVTASIK